MEMGLWVLISILIFIILLLWLKIRLLQKAAEEIRHGIAQKLKGDTNTLLAISSRNRHMKRLAADLNVQLRSLRREKLRCQQKNLEIMEAVTNLSHDLRTPLTAICGYLDLLKETENPADQHRYLAIMEERTQTLCELTEELFRYWTAVSSIREASFETVTLNSALEEILSACYSLLKDGGITPQVSLPEEKIMRRLNKSALSRIFGNILGNAIKYSDGDLTITLKKNGQIFFSNHAAGLNELQVLRLFDRFYTVETAANSTGIGLSIAKELTEQMNGSISAGYQEGILTITLSFPEIPDETAL